jgi:16S rRNA (uracil1498-N3)-methyltransferase
MHRFFVEPTALAGGAARLEGAVARQIARVLRLRRGERIILLAGDGDEYVVQLDHVSPAAVHGQVREKRLNRAEPSLQVTLYQGLTRHQSMELLLQKGTEVGVAAFVPVRCERTIAGREVELATQRLERWRRIVTEAAEQSRRGLVPAVRQPLKLSEALEHARHDGLAIVAWEGEPARSLRSALRAQPSGSPAPRHLGVFIGPEGGFADREIELARGLGATVVSLGPRILRAETAGPIVAALALYEAGDMEV